MRDHIKLTSKSVEVSGPGAVKVALAWFGLRAFGIASALLATVLIGAAQGVSGLAVLARVVQ
ncbi:MAG: hypothetical protein Q7T61_00450 [Caulobacter sp.]|nr:hypothetical protein [Caulobacter sp.]